MFWLLIILLDVVALCIDDAFQIIHVDVALNDNQSISYVAGISEDNLVGILAITAYERRQMFTAMLVGHNLLIVIDLVKILQMLAELISYVAAAFTQIKHLHRRDA